MGAPQTASQLTAYNEQTFIYPRSTPIIAQEHRQMNQRFIDSFWSKADGGLVTTAGLTQVLGSAANRAPSEKAVTVAIQKAVEAGTGGRVALTGITEFRDRFGETFNGSLQEFAEQLLIRYQAPQFQFFQLGGQGSRVEEVGTSIPTGFKSFTWATSNGQNVVPNSIAISDETTGTELATGEANDGAASGYTQAFTVVRGRSRQYRITAENSQGNGLVADLFIDGLYRSYFGYSAATSLDMAGLMNLGNGVLQNGKNRTVSGVTAGQGLYTYYCYEASAGDLSSIILDGAAPVLGAFTKLADVTGPNAQGATVTLRVYRSNAPAAFSNNSLAFS